MPTIMLCMVTTGAGSRKVESRQGNLAREDTVIYREQFAPEFYAERHGSVLLKQHSRLGFWATIGLGTTLTLFIAYLIYVNVIVQPASVLSLERSLRVMAAPIQPIPPPLTSSNRSAHSHRHGKAITVIPQSRAANAFLGGQGPALLP